MAEIRGTTGMLSQAEQGLKLFEAQAGHLNLADDDGMLIFSFFHMELDNLQPFGKGQGCHFIPPKQPCELHNVGPRLALQRSMTRRRLRSIRPGRPGNISSADVIQDLAV